MILQVCYRSQQRQTATTIAMDMVAGAGGMFGQLAVGIAGGSPQSGAMPGFDQMAKMAPKVGAKPTIDNLPDKVRLIEMAVRIRIP